MLGIQCGVSAALAPPARSLQASTALFGSHGSRPRAVLTPTVGRLSLLPDACAEQVGSRTQQTFIRSFVLVT